MPQYKRKLSKGIRWYYKFSYLGKTYFSKAIYHTKQEASKAERYRYNEVEERSRNINSNSEMELQDLINLRLDYVKAAKSSKYYRESRYYLKKLYNNFGNLSVKEITKSDLQKFLIDQSKKQHSQKNDNYVINAMIRAYKALFNYGINYLELEIRNPCLGISMFPITKKVKYIPTDEEIDNVLRQCNEFQKELLEFVRDTGCRISEALNLRHRDVFDGYVILYTRKSKASNLTPRRANYDTSKLPIRDCIDERVFDSWCEAPKFLSKKTKGKWNWHNLRHRFASILSQNNTPLFEIMSKLGHNNIQTTQNYLQLLINS